MLRHVTMRVEKFLDRSQQQGVFATATTNTEKIVGLDWQKKQNNFARASRFFVHFLAVAVARLPHETNFTRPLYGAQHKNFLFFPNLDTVLSDLNQKISPTFDKLNEVK